MKIAKLPRENQIKHNDFFLYMAMCARAHKHKYGNDDVIVLGLIEAVRNAINSIEMLASIRQNHKY